MKGIHIAGLAAMGVVILILLVAYVAGNKSTSRRIGPVQRVLDIRARDPVSQRFSKWNREVPPVSPGDDDMI